LQSYIIKEDGLSSINKVDRRSSSFQIGPKSSKKQTANHLPNFDIHDEVMIEDEKKGDNKKQYRLPSLNSKAQAGLKKQQKKTQAKATTNSGFVVDKIIISEKDNA